MKYSEELTYSQRDRYLKKARFTAPAKQHVGQEDAKGAEKNYNIGKKAKGKKDIGRRFTRIKHR